MDLEPRIELSKLQDDEAVKSHFKEADLSGGFTTTSHDLTPNGGLCGEWPPLYPPYFRLVKDYNSPRLYEICGLESSFLSREPFCFMSCSRKSNRETRPFWEFPPLEPIPYFQLVGGLTMLETESVGPICFVSSPSWGESYSTAGSGPGNGCFTGMTGCNTPPVLIRVWLSEGGLH